MEGIVSVKTISSRDFNQDVSGAKRAAHEGPVFITDRGKVSHVLLSIDEYQKVTTENRSMVDMLAMDFDEDFDFEPPQLDGLLIKPAVFD